MFSLKKTKRPCFTIKGGMHNGECVYLEENLKKPGVFSDMIVDDGSCMVSPPTGEDDCERHCIYICGPSGSGKSTWCSMYARAYKKKHSRNPIVLISPKDEDPVLDRLNPIRIRLDEENFLDEETKLGLDELEKSLVILDDIEAIADKDIHAAVMALRDQIMTLGRSKQISICCTSHLVCNNKATRIPAVESQFFVFYPGSGLTYQSNRYLKSYCGLSNKQIERLNNTPSRWLCVHRNYPMYAIGKDCAYTI